MPRPKKDNADYFSHDSGMRNDPKIKALRRKYSEGYSVYNMLLEVLTGSNFFSIELTVLNVELLAGDFDIEAEKLTEIIDYCVRIELLIKQENKIYSNGLKNRLQPVIDKRNTAKDKFLLQKPIITNVSVTENTQSKVKYSKVKESIKNNIDYSSSTANAEIDETDVSLNFAKKTLQEIEQKIKTTPVDQLCFPEEEFSAAVEYLKTHKSYRLLSERFHSNEKEIMDWFKIFYEDKDAFDAFKGKNKQEIMFNFKCWVEKRIIFLRQKNQTNGNQNYKSSNTIQPAKDFGKL